MATVDTNVLLRWLLNDVPEQAGAAETLFLQSNDRLRVPDLVLMELVYVLERVMRLTRRTVAEAVTLVLEQANFDVDRDVWRPALQDYLDHPKLSITDTFLHVQAQRSGATPLLTFDRKLASQLADARLLS